MGNYITTIEDLVSEALSNFSKINTSADRGDAESCFKMGMIYLLGINTQVWFQKASQYFNNPSLSDDNDAIRLLGFIKECEGNFSQALQCYAKTEGSEKGSYINKVFKGRNHLQDYLMRYKLPLSLNEEITSILNDYVKEDYLKTHAAIEIAAICLDEPTCIEAAQCLFEDDDYISAIDWLKRGNVASDNPVYVSINDQFKKSTLDLLSSKDLQVIYLRSNSLLFEEDITPFLTKLNNLCNEASAKCSIDWRDSNKIYIGKIIQNYFNNQAELAYLEEVEAKRRRESRNLSFVFVILIIFIVFAFIIYLGLRVSSSHEKETKINDSIETKLVISEKTEEANIIDVEKTEELVCSEKYLRNYLEENLPLAIKMNVKDAVEKYFSKEFIDLYVKVDKFDEMHISNGDYELGFWDFDFWNCGQEGETENITVYKVSEFNENNAYVILKIDDMFSSIAVIFEDGMWKIDDIHDYKSRLREYLKMEVEQ